MGLDLLFWNFFVVFFGNRTYAHVAFGTLVLVELDVGIIHSSGVDEFGRVVLLQSNCVKSCSSGRLSKINWFLISTLVLIIDNRIRTYLPTTIMWSFFVFLTKIIRNSCFSHLCMESFILGQHPSMHIFFSIWMLDLKVSLVLIHASQRSFICVKSIYILTCNRSIGSWIISSKHDLWIIFLDC